MIGLLIGGTVVFCAGLVTVVFGIPIKEFSFGNTMILAGAVVSCTGLILIGLYFVGRELRGLASRFDAGVPAAVPLSEVGEMPASAAIVRAAKIAPPKPSRAAVARPTSSHEDTLFVRDQPHDLGDHDLGDFADEPASPEPTPSAPAFPWEKEAAARTRPPVARPEPIEPTSEPPKRPRRNIMFSSTRREFPPREEVQRDPPSVGSDLGHHQPTDELQDHNPGSREPGPAPRNLFDAAWPQSDRLRRDPAAPRNERKTSSPEGGDEQPEAAPERYQPPRRAEPEAVTIVKSGVVDSMAYSLYSDGSIEAQMPEGMVRFASIDELRAHLDQRN